MKIRKIIFVATTLSSLTFIWASSIQAADFSNEDQAFVAKVSQGGMYEVKLGKLAEDKAVSPEVKKNGEMEANDHHRVGRNLEAILVNSGYQMPSFNAHFQARLDKMNALPADKFDAAYLADMKKIHDDDGAAFAKEAKDGTNPDLKKFAAETYDVVQRHLGELAKIKKS